VSVYLAYLLYWFIVVFVWVGLPLLGLALLCGLGVLTWRTAEKLGCQRWCIHRLSRVVYRRYL
jgi:hypothetical protein